MPDRYLYPMESQRLAVEDELRQRAFNEPTWRKWMHQVGHRGAFLITSALMYLAMGGSYAYGVVAHRTLISLQFPIQVMEWFGVTDPQHAVNIWGLLWTACGLIALVTAFWPPGWDFMGFITLYSFAVVWAVFNVVSAVAFDAPRAQFTGAVFLAHAVTVMIVSGMVDPTPVYRLLEEDRDAK